MADELHRSNACGTGCRTAGDRDVLAGAGGAAESDLARATEMALAAETRLGFSRHRPLLYRSASAASHALVIDDTLAHGLMQGSMPQKRSRPG